MNAPTPIEPPTEDEYGAQVHPAYGMIGASRVSHSPPGKVLFQSDVRHQHYVVLRIDRASRARQGGRDWVYSPGFGDIVEVSMSEAQWASFVSSMNTAGVPCTIEKTEAGGEMAGLEFDQRLELSVRETERSAHAAFAEIQEAFKVAQEKPTKANMRTLQARIENAPKNVEFAAKQLTKHAEDVVQHARADVEAMIAAKARELGIDPTYITPGGLGQGGQERELEG